LALNTKRVWLGGGENVELQSVDQKRGRGGSFWSRRAWEKALSDNRGGDAKGEGLEAMEYGTKKLYKETGGRLRSAARQK